MNQKTSDLKKIISHSEDKLRKYEFLGLRNFDINKKLVFILNLGLSQAARLYNQDKTLKKSNKILIIILIF